MKRLFGFSLIELLVILFLTTIFLTVTLASYIQFWRQKDLEKETKKFVDVLELAKRKTITADASLCSGGAPASVVKNYWVSVTDSTSYSIVPICLEGAPNNINFSLSQGNNFYGITTYPLSILFFSIATGATLAVGPTPTPIAKTGIVIRNNSGRCWCIAISKSGVVNDCRMNDCTDDCSSNYCL